MRGEVQAQTCLWAGVSAVGRVHPRGQEGPGGSWHSSDVSGEARDGGVAHTRDGAGAEPREVSRGPST